LQPDPTGDSEVLRAEGVNVGAIHDQAVAGLLGDQNGVLGGEHPVRLERSPQT
jgi:hypothetical protein